MYCNLGAKLNCANLDGLSPYLKQRSNEGQHRHYMVPTFLRAPSPDLETKWSDEGDIRFSPHAPPSDLKERYNEDARRYAHRIHRIFIYIYIAAFRPLPIFWI